MAAKQTTTLDTDVSKPTQTAPGDGPADTTDPLERASTVVPRPGPEALRAGTVNSQLPLEPLPDTSVVPGDNDRIEEYEATDASGKRVRVQRNIETGESRIVRGGSTDTGATPTQRASA
jgi:hypothetical protein